MQFCASPLANVFEDLVHMLDQFAQVYRSVKGHVNLMTGGKWEKYIYFVAGTQTHDERVNVA